MKRYIEAENLKQTATKWFGTEAGRAYVATFNAIVDKTEHADVAPVVHGHWKWKDRYRGGFRIVKGVMKNGEEVECQIDERRIINEPYCSICNMWNDGSTLNYCPNCGAKMDESVKE